MTWTRQRLHGQDPETQTTYKVCTYEQDHAASHRVWMKETRPAEQFGTTSLGWLGTSASPPCLSTLTLSSLPLHQLLCHPFNSRRHLPLSSPTLSSIPTQGQDDLNLVLFCFFPFLFCVCRYSLQASLLPFPLSLLFSLSLRGSALFSLAFRKPRPAELP
ncbi:hypothetical protein LX36DRAFT_208314 [Colletotrichum falcatum]|nr:hypothetical protein LX36DRAFT_208314 [Colletotrichum falcatum]